MAQTTATRSRRFGAIRRLPSGRFQAHWTGPDRHRHNAPDTFDTVEAAEAWLEQVRVDQHAGTYIDDRLSAMTLERWVAKWRPTIVHLRRSSLVRDIGYVDRYVLPALGDRPLAELDHMTVAGWVAELRTRLAPATVVKAAQTLGKILDAAVKDGRLRSNPVAGVDLPRIEKTRKQALGPAQIEQLADAIDPRYRALVIVGCHTGLRFSELAALTAGDVDLLRRRLTVERNVVDLGRLEHSNVKTDAGRRVVPLDRRAVEVLEPIVGGARHPDDLLFEAPLGGFLRLNSWRARFWNPAVKAAGLGHLTPHNMRDTAISMWLRAGTDPAAVARWAGHRSVITVLDRYAHELPDHAEAHLDRLDAYVAAASSSSTRPGTITDLPRRDR